MKNACSYFSPISSTQRGASARPRIKVAGALGQLRGMEQFERTAVRIVRIGSVSADLGTPETAAAPHIADMIRCEPLLEACPERRNGFANGGDNACSVTRSARARPWRRWPSRMPSTRKPCANANTRAMVGKRDRRIMPNKWGVPVRCSLTRINV